MAREDKDSEKIISIADARKKQRTLGRVGASARGNGAVRRDATKGEPASPRLKIWAYVQFILFLVVLAYFMQLCRGG